MFKKRKLKKLINELFILEENAGDLNIDFLEKWKNSVVGRRYGNRERLNCPCLLICTPIHSDCPLYGRIITCGGDCGCIYSKKFGDIRYFYHGIRKRIKKYIEKYLKEKISLLITKLIKKP